MTNFNLGMPFSFTKILKIKNDNNVKDIHHKLLEGLTKSSTDQIFYYEIQMNNHGRKCASEYCVENAIY